MIIVKNSSNSKLNIIFTFKIIIKVIEAKETQ